MEAYHLRVLLHDGASPLKVLQIDLHRGCSRKELLTTLSDLLLGPLPTRWKLAKEHQEETNDEDGSLLVNVVQTWTAKSVELFEMPHDDCCPVRSIDPAELPHDVDLYAYLAGAYELRAIKDEADMRAWWTAIPTTPKATRQRAMARLVRKLMAPSPPDILNWMTDEVRQEGGAGLWELAASSRRHGAAAGEMTCRALVACAACCGDRMVQPPTPPVSHTSPQPPGSYHGSAAVGDGTDGSGHEDDDGGSIENGDYVRESMDSRSSLPYSRPLSPSPVTIPTTFTTPRAPSFADGLPVVPGEVEPADVAPSTTSLRVCALVMYAIWNLVAVADMRARLLQAGLIPALYSALSTALRSRESGELGNTGLMLANQVIYGCLGCLGVVAIDVEARARILKHQRLLRLLVDLSTLSFPLPARQMPEVPPEEAAPAGPEDAEEESTGEPAAATMARQSSVAPPMETVAEAHEEQAEPSSEPSAAEVHESGHSSSASSASESELSPEDNPGVHQMMAAETLFIMMARDREVRTGFANICGLPSLLPLLSSSHPDISSIALFCLATYARDYDGAAGGPGITGGELLRATPQLSELLRATLTLVEDCIEYMKSGITTIGARSHPLVGVLEAGVMGLWGLVAAECASSSSACITWSDVARLARALGATSKPMAAFAPSGELSTMNSAYVLAACLTNINATNKLLLASYAESQHLRQALTEQLRLVEKVREEVVEQQREIGRRVTGKFVFEEEVAAEQMRVRSMVDREEQAADDLRQRITDLEDMFEDATHATIAAAQQVLDLCSTPGAESQNLYLDIMSCCLVLSLAQPAYPSLVPVTEAPEQLFLGPYRPMLSQSLAVRMLAKLADRGGQESEERAGSTSSSQLTNALAQVMSFIYMHLAAVTEAQHPDIVAQMAAHIAAHVSRSASKAPLISCMWLLTLHLENRRMLLESPTWIDYLMPAVSSSLACLKKELRPLRLTISGSEDHSSRRLSFDVRPESSHTRDYVRVIRFGTLSTWAMVRQWLADHMAPVNMLGANGLYKATESSWWKLKLTFETPLTLSDDVVKGLELLLSVAGQTESTISPKLRVLALTCVWNLCDAHPAVPTKLVELGLARLLIDVLSSAASPSPLKVIAAHVALLLSGHPAHLEALGGLDGLVDCLVQLMVWVLGRSNLDELSVDVELLETIVRALASLAGRPDARPFLVKHKAVPPLVKIVRLECQAMDEVMARRENGELGEEAGPEVLLCPVRLINRKPVLPSVLRQWQLQQQQQDEEMAYSDRDKASDAAREQRRSSSPSSPRPASAGGASAGTKQRRQEAYRPYSAQVIRPHSSATQKSVPHTHDRVWSAFTRQPSDGGPDPDEEEVGVDGEGELGLLALWALSNMSLLEEAQPWICHHGLYTLLRVVHTYPCQRRSNTAAEVLTGVRHHPENATVLYKAELRLKASALLKYRGEDKASGTRVKLTREMLRGEKSGNGVNERALAKSMTRLNKHSDDDLDAPPEDPKAAFEKWASYFEGTDGVSPPAITDDPEEAEYERHLESARALERYLRARVERGKFMRGSLARALAAGASQMWEETGTGEVQVQALVPKALKPTPARQTKPRPRSSTAPQLNPAPRIANQGSKPPSPKPSPKMVKSAGNASAGIPFPPVYDRNPSLGRQPRATNNSGSGAITRGNGSGSGPVPSPSSPRPQTARPAGHNRLNVPRSAVKRPSTAANARPTNNPLWAPAIVAFRQDPELEPRQQTDLARRMLNIAAPPIVLGAMSEMVEQLVKAPGAEPTPAPSLQPSQSIAPLSQRGSILEAQPSSISRQTSLAFPSLNTLAEMPSLPETPRNFEPPSESGTVAGSTRRTYVSRLASNLHNSISISQAEVSTPRSVFDENIRATSAMRRAESSEEEPEGMRRAGGVMRLVSFAAIHQSASSISLSSSASLRETGSFLPMSRLQSSTGALPRTLQHVNEEQPKPHRNYVLDTHAAATAVTALSTSSTLVGCPPSQSAPNADYEPQLLSALQLPTSGFQQPTYGPVSRPSSSTSSVRSTRRRRAGEEIKEKVPPPLIVSDHVPRPVTVLAASVSDLLSLRKVSQRAALPAPTPGPATHVSAREQSALQVLRKHSAVDAGMTAEEEKEEEEVKVEAPKQLALSVLVAPGGSSVQHMYKFNATLDMPPDHMCLFQHVEGCKFCESLYGHYLLPNGKLAHFYWGGAANRTNGRSVPRMPPPAVPYTTEDWLHDGLPTTNVMDDYLQPGRNNELLLPLWCPVPALGPVPPERILEWDKQQRHLQMQCINVHATMVDVVERVVKQQRMEIVQSPKRGAPPASPFANRPQANDSQDMVDRHGIEVDVFDCDWRRALAKESFKKFLERHGVVNNEQTDQVRRALRERYVRLVYLFDYYSCHAAGTVLELRMSAWSQLMEDIKVAGEVCGASELDTIFRTANAEVSKSLVEAKMYVDGSLQRFDVVDALVRVAAAAFLSPSTSGGSNKRITASNDLKSSVIRLVDDYLLRNAAQPSLVDPNLFRSLQLYKPPVLAILRRETTVLRAVWDHYRRKASGPLDNMAITEWLRLMSDSKVLSPQFTEREAGLAFVWARMRSIDDMASIKAAKQVRLLTFIDYLEALCRAATLWHLPEQWPTRPGSGNAQGDESAEVIYSGSTEPSMYAKLAAVGASVGECPLSERLQAFLEVFLESLMAMVHAPDTKTLVLRIKPPEKNNNKRPGLGR